MRWESLRYPSASLPLKSRTFRCGQGTLSMSSARVTHSYPATPATAAKPPARKPRLVRLRNSRLRSCAGRMISRSRLFIALHQFVTHDHAAEVVPACKYDLHDVNNKEQQISGCQKKVNEASTGVTAEAGSQPGKLGGFVDRETTQNRTDAHEDDACIGDLLSSVVFVLYRF